MTNSARLLLIVVLKHLFKYRSSLRVGHSRPTASKQRRQRGERQVARVAGHRGGRHGRQHFARLRLRLGLLALDVLISGSHHCRMLFSNAVGVVRFLQMT